MKLLTIYTGNITFTDKYEYKFLQDTEIKGIILSANLIANIVNKTQNKIIINQLATTTPNEFKNIVPDKRILKCDYSLKKNDTIRLKLTTNQNNYKAVVLFLIK